jgi:hypothetical protein
LVEATGSDTHLITSVEVFGEFVIVERGPAAASDISPPVLSKQTARRPSRVVRTTYRAFEKLHRKAKQARKRIKQVLRDFGFL